jgi:hypothetical protein
MKTSGGRNRTNGIAGRLAALASLLVLGQGAAAPAADGIAAIRARDFLDSIGVNSSISVRGESLEKTIACARYLGVRWFRAGIEGNIPMRDFVELHKRAGVRFSWGLGSGGTDIARLIETGRQMAAAGALLAFEGPNEPNNWGITYQGQAGGRSESWVPVAQLQRDLYDAVKSDPVLKRYPVWSITEGGAETDNVGLQFLSIPRGAGTVMPAGTRYADHANVHNYIYHPNVPGLEDNKTWKAADPSSACKVDGLFGEYGVTWARHYAGYPEARLGSLPRVTTETGALIDGPITEEIHALNLLSLYLDQFKRGWSHTAVYLLRDRVDEAGNQRFGFYKPDYTPRKAAVYLHNLTTILADTGSIATPGRLDYSIPHHPETVHDLLLQKNEGTLDLVVWDERLRGVDTVTVDLGATYGTATICDPTVGTKATRSLSRVRSVTLKLSDHPVVIEIPGGR